MKFSEETKKKIVLGYDRNVGSVEEYCIKQSISKASFYKWRTKYKENNTEIIDITDKIITEPINDENLKLNINKVEIVLTKNYDEELLLKVVRSLKKL